MASDTNHARTPDQANAADKAAPAATAVEAVEAAKAEPRLEELSSRHHRFIWPMTVFFLVYYLSLPFLAGEFPGVMGRKLFGEFTVGYLFALSQFLMAFVVAWAYTRWARRRLDPVAEGLRRQLMAQGKGDGA